MVFDGPTAAIKHIKCMANLGSRSQFRWFYMTSERRFEQRWTWMNSFQFVQKEWEGKRGKKLPGSHHCWRSPVTKNPRGRFYLHQLDSPKGNALKPLGPNWIEPMTSRAGLIKITGNRYSWPPPVTAKPLEEVDDF